MTVLVRSVVRHRQDRQGRTVCVSSVVTCLAPVPASSACSDDGPESALVPLLVFVWVPESFLAVPAVPDVSDVAVHSLIAHAIPESRTCRHPENQGLPVVVVSVALPVRVVPVVGRLASAHAELCLAADPLEGTVVVRRPAEPVANRCRCRHSSAHAELLADSASVGRVAASPAALVDAVAAAVAVPGPVAAAGLAAVG